MTPYNRGHRWAVVRIEQSYRPVIVPVEITHKARVFYTVQPLDGSAAIRIRENQFLKRYPQRIDAAIAAETYTGAWIEYGRKFDALRAEQEALTIRFDEVFTARDAALKRALTGQGVVRLVKKTFGG